MQGLPAAWGKRLRAHAAAGAGGPPQSSRSLLARARAALAAHSGACHSFGPDLCCPFCPKETLLQHFYTLALQCLASRLYQLSKHVARQSASNRTGHLSTNQGEPCEALNFLATTCLTGTCFFATPALNTPTLRCPLNARLQASFAGVTDPGSAVRQDPTLPAVLQEPPTAIELHTRHPLEMGKVLVSPYTPRGV